MRTGQPRLRVAAVEPTFGLIELPFISRGGDGMALAYDTLLICTLPPGLSRWLKLDLVHRAGRKFGLRVIHVVAEALAPTRP